MTPNALFWLTFGPYLAAAIVSLTADAVFRRESSAGTISAALLLGAGGVVGLVGGWMSSSGILHGVLVVGGAHSTVSGLIGILAAASLLSVSGAQRVRLAQGAPLVALASFGAGLSASTNDLVMLLIALEIVAVCAYALVVLSRDKRSAEAGLKYYIQGAIATGLFVLGLAVIVPFAGGSLTYAMAGQVVSSLAPATPGLVAVLLIVAALLLKAGAAPFHWWAPDVYETAPPFASAFLAGAVKLGVITAVGTLVYVGVPIESTITLAGDSLRGNVAVVLAVFAVMSIVIGSFGALAQSSYARMLGYAGIAQVGYALVALAAMNPTASIVLIATYAVAATVTFSAVGVFAVLRPRWDGSVSGLAGMGRAHPVLGVSVSLALVSLAGIPPLVGFWGKFQAFGAAILAALSLEGAQGGLLALMYWALIATAVLGSIVSLAYYGSVIRALFFDSESEVVIEVNPVDNPSDVKRATVVIASLAALLTLAGAMPFVFGLAVALQGFLLRL